MPRAVVGIGPNHLIAQYELRHPGADTTLIELAFDTAAKAHVTQTRKTGEPYLAHPVAVAIILADLGLDDVTISAALLHDAVEDSGLTVADIEAEFGADVAGIVDGVTKLERVKFDSKEAQQAASMRKMLVAMAKDLRVLLIKLADRLHNMRTLAAFPEAKQRRIAQETLDIYAPLAHRLGIGELRWQLEDLAFSVLHPKRFAAVEHMVSARAPEREELIEEVVTAVRTRLHDLTINAEVTGRPKHAWSIYEKMIIGGKEFDEIHDLLGIRVIVDGIEDCYGCLGSIHALWVPVQGRFKDYIAMPKYNLYQSLHTTVVGPGGKFIEFQIRTKEMHERAEIGVAAHWGYKENRAPGEEIAWLERIVDWQSETDDPSEFMESLKVDLEQDEVFVFTPKGDVVTLVAGAGPIDFAYSIHTEVGHRCIGAKINGRLVPLDSRLSSGDTVEIFTSKVDGAGPSRDWLGIVHTPRARNKIRQRFSKERRGDAIDHGREELSKAFRREGLSSRRLADSAELAGIIDSFGYHDLDGLHGAIGEGNVSARAVTQRVARELHSDSASSSRSVSANPAEVATSAPQGRSLGRSHRSQVRSAGVTVEGLDDVMVRLSRCCTPVPGDAIIGFVTRGRGVSVHRSDCANAEALSTLAERLVDVVWDLEAPGSYVVSVQVEALDRSNLLADAARVLSEHHVNILACVTLTAPDRVAKLRFDFELADPAHLNSIVAALARIDSVFDAYRVLPGRTS